MAVWIWFLTLPLRRYKKKLMMTLQPGKEEEGRL